MKKGMAIICVLILVMSTLPLYAISIYNHPYYDDFGFSASVHHAWLQTGDVGEVIQAALANAEHIRQTWQGTYLGTILTNIQPGLFSESLYWTGNVWLLTAFIACMLFFFGVVFKRLGLERLDRISLGCLAVTLLLQMMPDVSEAFYWFNGGVGNTFVYSLIALGAALLVQWLEGRRRLFWLMLLAVLLGGGSYGGGLFVSCCCVVLAAWLMSTKHRKRWWFVGLTLLFGLCFAYNVTAPGNTIRSWMIGYRVSPVLAVAQSMYYGVGQMGKYITLPLLAITLVMLPSFVQAAKKSDFSFKHPWWVLMGMTCLYCTQFAPPMYSIASIGDGRIVNTYFISFIAGWFVYVYYIIGFVVRRYEIAFELSPRQFGALALTSVVLLGVGCLSFRREDDVLYGVQNLSGPSAALSIVTGEAAQYHHEMSQREALLNDPNLSEVTLKRLTCKPAVFMDDLMEKTEDVSGSLGVYYGKESIRLEGVEAP